MDGRKRRNSILKTSSKDDDPTTADVTIARTKRVSFGGKKSVREFRTELGETIWHSTYEVPDNISTPESESTGQNERRGLVDVHRKQIMLRSRRVICDSKTKHTAGRKSQPEQQESETQKIEKPNSSSASTSSKNQTSETSKQTTSAGLHTQVNKSVTYSSVVIGQGAAHVEQTFDFTLLEAEKTRLAANNLNIFNSFWIDESEKSAVNKRGSMESTEDFQGQVSETYENVPVATQLENTSMVLETPTRCEDKAVYDSDGMDLSYRFINNDECNNNEPNIKLHQNTRFSCAMDFDADQFEKSTNNTMDQTMNQSIEISIRNECNQATVNASPVNKTLHVNEDIQESLECQINVENNGRDNMNLSFSFSDPKNIDQTQAADTQHFTIPMEECSFGIFANQPKSNLRKTIHFNDHIQSDTQLFLASPNNESQVLLTDVTRYTNHVRIPLFSYNESAMLSENSLSPVLPPEYASNIKTTKRLTLREINDAIEKGIIPVLHETPKPANAQNKQHKNKSDKESDKSVFKCIQLFKSEPTKSPKISNSSKEMQQNLYLDLQQNTLLDEQSVSNEINNKEQQEQNINFDIEAKFSATTGAIEMNDEKCEELDNTSMPSLFGMNSALEESEHIQKLASLTKDSEAKVNSTLYFDQELDVENVSFNENFPKDQEQAGINSTIYLHQNSLSLDTEDIPKEIITSDKKTEDMEIDLESDNIDGNTFSAKFLKNSEVERKTMDCGKTDAFFKNRKTIYFEQDCVIDTNHLISDEKEEKCQNIRSNIKIIDNDEKCPGTTFVQNGTEKLEEKQMSDLVEVVEHLNISVKFEVPVDNNMDCSSEHPNDSFVKILESLQKSRGNASTRRTIKFSEDVMNAGLTPERNIKARTIYEGTPHRSIIEFEALELEVQSRENSSEQRISQRRRTNYDPLDMIHDVSGLTPIDMGLEASKLMMSPVAESDSFSKKRSTILMTPNFPTSKKRQTNLFFGCDMEESLVVNNENISKVEKSRNRQTNLFLKDMTIEPYVGKITENIGAASLAYMEKAIKEVTNKRNEPFTAIEMETTNNISVSGNLDMNNLYITPNNKQRISRIPICTGSANKSSLIKDRTLAPKQQVPITIDHSLDTIPEPRAVALMEAITNPNPELMNQTQNQSNTYMQDDKPITISDVSEYYTKLRDAINFTSDTFRTTLEPPKCDTAEICLLDASETQTEVATEPQAENDWERLSRVATLLKGNSVEEILKGVDVCEVDMNDCSLLKNNVQSNENSILCRKCKRCQQTVNESSFNMPSMLELDVSNTGLPPLRVDRLKRLQEIPSIEDVDEYYRRRELKLGLDMASLTAVFNCEIDKNTECKPDKADLIIAEYKKRIERKEAEILKTFDSIERRISFSKHLGDIIKTRCKNWIYNSKKDCENILVFRHKRIISFAIVLQYEKTGAAFNCIKIKSVQIIEDSCYPKKNWIPLDYLLHFQLKLELPAKLESFCESDTAEGVFDMLEKVDNICKDIFALGCSLWTITRDTMGELKRAQNQVSIEKVIRRIHSEEGNYPRVLKTVIRIEISNMRNVSYRNIMSPPLQVLREDIQFLPSGLEFLQSFLINPLRA